MRGHPPHAGGDGERGVMSIDYMAGIYCGVMIIIVLIVLSIIYRKEAP